MDQARERRAGPAPGRRGASRSDSSDSSGAARAAAAASVDDSSGAAQAAAAAGSGGAGSDAAQAAAAATQAICRTLRDRPALLEAVALAAGAATDASTADELKRVVSAGAESAPVGAETAAVLGALSDLCDNTQTGAARIAAAGLLPQVVALLRSPYRGAACAAVALCWGAAMADAAAKAALACDPSTVPALLALLCGAPPPWDEADVAALSMAAELLGCLAVSSRSRGATLSGGAVAGAGGSAVTAAVLAGGGVARIVAVLRAALGGGGQSLDIRSAGGLLMALNAFGTHPGAAAAARAAGALPLAARAVVAAQRTPGTTAKCVLSEAAHCIGVLAATDDLPALAARPDLIRALAGAVALAADGASEDWSACDAERLGNSVCGCVGQLLAGGQGSTDAAAQVFLAAGGAAHLVRRRACVSASAG
jgi:hypothetical protein